MLFEVNNLYFSYYRSPLTVRGAHFSFDKNDKVLLLASKDMGKTTMLKVLSGFDETYLGSIKLNGKELKTILESERNFSLLLCDTVLFENKSIKFNLNYASKIVNGNELSDEQISEKLKGFNINIDINKKVSKLSKFEKRKLTLARSELKNPSIIFLDDNFEDLNEEESVEFEKYVNRVYERKSALVMAISDDTFINHNEFLSNLKFDNVLYLCDSELYYYDSISQFEKELINIDALKFVTGYKRLDGVIYRVESGLYFTDEKTREIELDKKLNNKLEWIKYEVEDYDKVAIFYNGELDLVNIEADEFNKNLIDGKFLAYSTLDGKKLF